MTVRACALVAAALVLVAGGAQGSSRAVVGITTTTVTADSLSTAVSAGRLPSAPVGTAATATWCGSATDEDLSPNTVPGHPVHWIYAVPADAADRMAEIGSLMQTDAELIDAWWRSQDATRVPRNDLTSLPCGVQIDLTTLRLPASGAELATSELFSDIYTHLFEEDFRSSYTKHMVYYDGPLATDRICGQGGSSSSGFGLAVVYVRACSGVASAAVAAHELLHTLGAVPRGAPNDCPEPNDAHTCDDPNDIMHPFIDRSPLASKALDPGRNDYYGHSSGFVDTQDSPWLVRLDSQAQLALQISGSGTVESDVPGLSCTQTCTTSWNSGTEVSLTATPGPGSKLVRFTGACTGAFDCTVTVGAGSAVSVLFAPLTYRLSVAVSGRGTVRSSRPGIACRSRCSAAFPSYVPLRLVATPAKGWKLRTWRGACTGTRASCTLPMSAAASARAVFVRR